MRITYKIIKTLILFSIALFSYADNSTIRPQKYIFIGGNGAQLEKYDKYLKDPNISGFQIVYAWKHLEPKYDQYDFSLIEQNLRYLNKYHKKLFIQIQDKSFFAQNKIVPEYIYTDPQYKGGIVSQIDGRKDRTGWVTMQWEPKVQLRFQKLLSKLAVEFDGKIAGINLSETAIDVKKAQQFSCDSYFNATMDNLKFLRQVFKTSYVVQYVNSFPCEWDNDHKYMSRIFEYASKNHIGLGGPDVIPDNKPAMHNSYPFFNRYKGKLFLVAIAIQSPDHSYINPKTKKHYTNQEIMNFAKDYLGANILFIEV